MAAQNETLKLIRMNEVEVTEIDWLLYPYIPYGKSGPPLQVVV